MPESDYHYETNAPANQGHLYAVPASHTSSYGQYIDPAGHPPPDANYDSTHKYYYIDEKPLPNPPLPGKLSTPACQPSTPPR